MTAIDSAFPLFPSHDPVVGYFLGKMMKPQPDGPPPGVMLGGKVGGAEFTLTSLWNEDGLELEGGFSDQGGTSDFLSDMTPKFFIDPTGGFWGAAREMPVRSVMQVRESFDGSDLSGTHAESVLAEDGLSETSRMDTSLQSAAGNRFESSLTLYREKRLVPFSEGYMLVPTKGEVSLNQESATDKTRAVTEQPLSLSFDKDGSWRMKGEIITSNNGIESPQSVDTVYRLMRMPFFGVPYVQVDSKVGQMEAHYFIAPLGALIKLSGAISKILSDHAGKPVFIPPSKALETAKQVQNSSLPQPVPAAIPVSPSRFFYDVVSGPRMMMGPSGSGGLREGSQEPALPEKS